jgi:hypothetical protein
VVLFFSVLDHLDPRIGPTFIDTNVLDRTNGPEAAAADEIFRLHQENDDFLLHKTYSVDAEIRHSHTPAYVKRRAANLIYTEQVELTDPERETHEKVRALIQGNSKPGQHDRDAFHLVESAKYGRHFLTNDQRLLKKANEIWELLQLKVLAPSEWLAAYNAHARELHE